ncbi:Hypothetical protein CINCED_3A012931 [Cinara cedri]|uniref:Uncharacterized protein n=1 Tax=Cinara cedri TaxID=506608 RepID=A0A5E4MCJ0_9HEMI|nr:Hypothetical protein CINCED_3A012931 [Cinara cedri]
MCPFISVLEFRTAVQTSLRVEQSVLGFSNATAERFSSAARRRVPLRTLTLARLTLEFGAVVRHSRTAEDELGPEPARLKPLVYLAGISNIYGSAVRRYETRAIGPLFWLSTKPTSTSSVSAALQRPSFLFLRALPTAVSPRRAPRLVSRPDDVAPGRSAGMSTAGVTSDKNNRNEPGRKRCPPGVPTRAGAAYRENNNTSNRDSKRERHAVAFIRRSSGIADFASSAAVRAQRPSPNTFETETAYGSDQNGTAAVIATVE